MVGDRRGHSSCVDARVFHVRAVRLGEKVRASPGHPVVQVLSAGCQSMLLGHTTSVPGLGHAVELAWAATQQRKRRVTDDFESFLFAHIEASEASAGGARPCRVVFLFSTSLLPGF